MDNRIIIFDTTLRDGEQTPGVNLNMQEKLEIAKQLEKLGVDVIEAGFPAASPGDFEAVRLVSQNVSCGVAGLCRCVENDIRTAWDALQHAKKPRLHLFIATSPIHMEYKLHMQPDAVIENAIKAVKLARSLCEDVEFSCEDASRSQNEFLYRIIEAVIDAGASTINIPDTVGYAQPQEYGQLISSIVENVPNVDKAILSVHCHNDLGMATANSLAAIKGGARQIECTINGLGERAGNAALEEVIMNLETRKDYFDFTHNITPKRIYRTSQMVSRLSSVPLPVCKAIVGQNAFSHASGIHQHGMLENPTTYEIMTPESVGKKESTMVLGKLSGRHAFVERLNDLGFTLEKTELDEAFARFKVLADKKKTISDEDLIALLSQEISDVPAFYELSSFQLQTSNKIQSLGSVTLTHQDDTLQDAAIGDGPIDACYNAISRLVGKDFSLQTYDIHAVTQGEDALGEVTVRLKHQDKIYTGRGLASDIIESSILAYLNAVNRCLSQQH